MRFWQSSYGDRIYNLDYEKLTENQVSETKRQIKFLNIGWEDQSMPANVLWRFLINEAGIF